MSLKWFKTKRIPICFDFRVFGNLKLLKKRLKIENMAILGLGTQIDPQF